MTSPTFLTNLVTGLCANPNLSTLTEALTEPEGNAAPPTHGAVYPRLHSLTRLLAAGWTGVNIDTALTATTIPAYRPAALVALADLAHLPPDVACAWITGLGGDLPHVVAHLPRINLWQIAVGGPAAALCAAAGLTPDEGAALAATGDLDQITHLDPGGQR